MRLLRSVIFTTMLLGAVSGLPGLTGFELSQTCEAQGIPRCDSKTCMKFKPCNYHRSFTRIHRDGSTSRDESCGLKENFDLQAHPGCEHCHGCLFVPISGPPRPGVLRKPRSVGPHLQQTCTIVGDSGCNPEACDACDHSITFVINTANRPDETCGLKRNFDFRAHPECNKCSKCSFVPRTPKNGRGIKWHNVAKGANANIKGAAARVQSAYSRAQDVVLSRAKGKSPQTSVAN